MKSSTTGAIAASLVLLGVSSPGHADPMQTLGFTVTGGTAVGNTNSSFLGYAFTTASAISITGLGILSPGNAAISNEDHVVGLYTAGSVQWGAATGAQLLASTTVRIGETPNVGNAVINAITPVTLSAGTYWLGAFYSAGDNADLMYADRTAFTTPTGITWDRALDNISGNANFDHLDFTSTTQLAFFGPDFTFTAAVTAPEPASMTVLLAGLGVLGLMRRRRTS
jgi:hypothetical protein